MPSVIKEVAGNASAAVDDIVEAVTAAFVDSATHDPQIRARSGVWYGMYSMMHL